MNTPHKWRPKSWSNPYRTEWVKGFSEIEDGASMILKYLNGKDYHQEDIPYLHDLATHILSMTGGVDELPR